jgi:hypothetical protein
VDSSNGKGLLDKMFNVAINEQFSRLARKYDFARVFEAWIRIARAGGAREYFRKGEWEPQMTIEQALALVDDYRQLIESLIQKRPEEEGEADLLS